MCNLKYTIVFLFSYCLLSCNNEKVKKENIYLSENLSIIRPINSLENMIDIEPLLDTVRYVKLELTDKSIIGYIQKVAIFEDKIYVLDTQASSLFVFDINGKYLFKISQKGLGPHDYIQLDFFDIDIDKREIVLTDLMGYWTMRYDLDGNFIKRKKIPFFIEGIVPGSNGGFITYQNFRDNKQNMKQEYNLFYIDALMVPHKAYFPYNSLELNPPPTPRSGPFYYYNNNFHFFSIYGNEIYDITEDSLILKYMFDFGNKTFDKNMLNSPEDLRLYLEKGEYYSVKSVQETDELLCFSVSSSNMPILFIGYYSKKTKNVMYSPVYLIGKEGQILGMPVSSYGLWLINELPIDNLISWREDIDKNNILIKNSFLERQKKVANSLTLDDNPVLMFYKLKKF